MSEAGRRLDRVVHGVRYWENPPSPQDLVLVHNRSTRFMQKKFWDTQK